MRTIAVLITCHNRLKNTINCLQSLYNCNLPEDYVLDVFLVDDGSTDGTSKAVMNEFPLVNVIQGNGNLFWNRGMRLAWETAAGAKDYNFYLWLNDDTLLFNFALNMLLQKAQTTEGKQILVGVSCSSNKKEITYSGYQYYDKKLVPNGEWQICDYFNGNIVLIPQLVYKSIGLLDNKFTHALGDFDYGMRATKIGYLHLISPKAMGICDLNSTVPIWRNSDYKFIKRIRHLYSPLGNNPNEFFIIDSRQYGFLKAIIHYLTIHFRTLFPGYWR